MGKLEWYFISYCLRDYCGWQCEKTLDEKEARDLAKKHEKDTGHYTNVIDRVYEY